jgi:hypothetical protein
MRGPLAAEITQMSGHKAAVARLSVIQGPGYRKGNGVQYAANTTELLWKGRTLVIGRGPTALISLKLPLVSRCHFVLEVRVKCCGASVLIRCVRKQKPQ